MVNASLPRAAARLNGVGGWAVTSPESHPLRAGPLSFDLWTRASLGSHTIDVLRLEWDRLRLRTPT